MKHVILSFSLVALLAVSTAPAFTAEERGDPLEESGAVALTGCTPAREGALTNLAQGKLQCLGLCAASKIALPALEIVKQCGLKCGPPRESELQDYLDLIAGQKAGARGAGANIPPDPDPSAGTSYKPKEPLQ